MDACEAAHLGTRGNNDELRARLVQHQCEQLAKAPKDAPPLPPPDEPPSPPPPIAAAGGAKKSKKGKQPQADNGNDASQASAFGRRTFSMSLSEGTDKTEFFSDATKGQDVAVSSASQTDQLKAAVDGAIPVAALVKVHEGFLEVEDGDHQVAVLLAGLVR